MPGETHIDLREVARARVQELRLLEAEAAEAQELEAELVATLTQQRDQQLGRVAEQRDRARQERDDAIRLRDEDTDRLLKQLDGVLDALKDVLPWADTYEDYMSAADFERRDRAIQKAQDVLLAHGRTL